MTSTDVRPYALEPDQGWTYDFGVDFVVKVGELGQHRRLAVVEYTTRSGEEPPDHTHGTEDEMFYLLDGEITFRCGGSTFELTKGGFVFLPRGLEHGYTIPGDDPVRLLAITAPAPGESVANGSGWGGFVADFQKEAELRSSPGDAG